MPPIPWANCPARCGAHRSATELNFARSPEIATSLTCPPFVRYGPCRRVAQTIRNDQYLLLDSSHPDVRPYSFGAITHCVYAMGSVCACVPLADKNQKDSALTGLLAIFFLI